MRGCARLASQLGVTWHAVHVETPAVHRLSAARREQALRALKLAQELGAAIANPAAPEPVPALVRYAREHNLSRLVVGRGRRIRWPGQTSTADRIAELAEGDLDVLQMAVPAAARERVPSRRPAPVAGTFVWRGYVAAVTACALVALLAAPLHGRLELTTLWRRRATGARAGPIAAPSPRTGVGGIGAAFRAHDGRSGTADRRTGRRAAALDADRIPPADPSRRTARPGCDTPATAQGGPGGPAMRTTPTTCACIWRICARKWRTIRPCPDIC